MAQSTSEFLGAAGSVRQDLQRRQGRHPGRQPHRGVPDDEVDSGVIYIKRSGGKAQFRIDFTGPNSQSVEVREQLVEIYHPKLNEIQEYDLRAYKDVAQKLFLLGFGMPGRELAANYEIRTLSTPCWILRARRTWN